MHWNCCTYTVECDLFLLDSRINGADRRSDYRCAIHLLPWSLIEELLESSARKEIWLNNNVQSNVNVHIQTNAAKTQLHRWMVNETHKPGRSWRKKPWFLLHNKFNRLIRTSAEPFIYWRKHWIQKRAQISSNWKQLQRRIDKKETLNLVMLISSRHQSLTAGFFIKPPWRWLEQKVLSLRKSRCNWIIFEWQRSHRDSLKLKLNVHALLPFSSQWHRHRVQVDHKRYRL